MVILAGAVGMIVMLVEKLFRDLFIRLANTDFRIDNPPLFAVLQNLLFLFPGKKLRAGSVRRQELNPGTLSAGLAASGSFGLGRRGLNQKHAAGRGHNYRLGDFRKLHLKIPII